MLPESITWLAFLPCPAKVSRFILLSDYLYLSHQQGARYTLIQTDLRDGRQPSVTTRALISLVVVLGSRDTNDG